MGSSSAEIDDEIESTRTHLDANLDMLERRATSGLKRAAMMAGIGLVAGVMAGGAAYLVYRRVRKPTVRDRVQDAMPDFGDLHKELRKRFDNRPFRIVIANADTDERRSIWESTARKVAPSLVTSAAGALMAAVMNRGSGRSGDQPAE